MAFDKQSIGRRITVESNSNRSCYYFVAWRPGAALATDSVLTWYDHNELCSSCNDTLGDRCEWELAPGIVAFVNHNSSYEEVKSRNEEDKTRGEREREREIVVFAAVNNTALSVYIRGCIASTRVTFVYISLPQDSPSSACRTWHSRRRSLITWLSWCRLQINASDLASVWDVTN